MSTDPATLSPSTAGILPPDQGAPWHSELSRLEQELREMATQKTAVERATADLRQALEESQKHVAELIQQMGALQLREHELRHDLLQVHEQLLHRDDELRFSVRKLTMNRDALKAQNDALKEQRDTLKTRHDAARACLDDLNEQLRRVRPNLLGRLYGRIRKLLARGSKRPG